MTDLGHIQSVLGRRIIDLSQALEPDIPVPPGQPGPIVSVIASLDRGDAVNAEALELGLHTGTHVDAPYHFYSDREPSDMFSTPDRLLGRGVVLDMSHKHGAVPITVDDIVTWESGTAVTIMGGDILLVRTDHAKAWSTGERGKRYTYGGWPYLAATAIEYLISRKIKAVGVEAMDPDQVDFSKRDRPPWPAHHLFLAHDIPIMENLCGLEAIGSPTCIFIGLPLKLRGVSGAPLRAIAIV